MGAARNQANPAAEPPAPTVFISYRRDDAALVSRIESDIQAAGYRCWVDRSAIPGGEDWIQSIAAGMQQAAAVVAVVTPQARRSDWVRAEWALALLLNKRILPVLPSQCALPAVLGRVQAVALYPDERRGRALMLAALDALPLDVVGTPDAERPAHERDYLHRLQLEVVLHHELYTPLAGEARLSARRGAGTPIAVRMNPRLELLRRSLATDCAETSQRRPFDDVSDAFAAVTQAVVLGEPGAGKTTALFKIAGDALPAALADPQAPLPLLARLGLWTDEHESLAGFLGRRLGCPHAEAQRLLHSGRAIVLLDGLNEIPAAQRGRKAGEIRALFETERSLRGLVSCRALDYRDALDLGRDTLSIRPLDAPRILDFLRAYLIADLDPEHGTLEQRQAEGDARTQSLFWKLAGGTEVMATFQAWEKAGADLELFFSSHEIPRLNPDVYSATSSQQDHIWHEQVLDPRNLVRLAGNPYMLAMLVTVYDPHTGTLPANRAALFEAFVDALLAREGMATVGAGGLILSEPGQALLAGLDELAWALQTLTPPAGEKAGIDQAQTALHRQDAEALMTAPGLARAAGASLLDAGEQVRFTHQLLQEHFAARGLRRRLESGTLRAGDLWPQAKWWEPSGWEEVAVLLAGLYPSDCTVVLDWLADANPEAAARSARLSGAHVPGDTLSRLRERWMARLCDARAEPSVQGRAAVGRALGAPLRDALPLDPRAGVGVRDDARTGLRLPDIDWVRIPAGKFVYQAGERRSLPAFQIARYPVTHVQFQCFVDDPEGYANVDWWQGLAEGPGSPQSARWEEGNHPRETVSWFEVVAFGRWLSARLRAPRGRQIRLPTEWEWEKAARGTDGREFPWGGEYRAGLANIDETIGDAGTHDMGRTTPVGIYVEGVSPYGVADMAGNVWEWCANKFDPANDVTPGGNDTRVVRGGSWDLDQDGARCAYRDLNSPDLRYVNIGFRVVSSSRIS